MPDRADEIARELFEAMGRDILELKDSDASDEEFDASGRKMEGRIAAALRSYGDEKLQEAIKAIDNVPRPIGFFNSMAVSDATGTAISVLRSLASQPIQDKP